MVVGEVDQTLDSEIVTKPLKIEDMSEIATDYIEENIRKGVQVRDHTVAGELVNRYLREWKVKKYKYEYKQEIWQLKPWWRGNTLCFGYFKWWNEYEPMFTIGPDFKFSIVEILLFNFMQYLPLQKVS